MQFILVRETWSHMSSVSGFDGLFYELEFLCNNNTVSFFASQYEKKPAQSRWRRLFNAKPNNSFGTWKFSPFVEDKHNRLAVDVINAMNRYPKALVLLSVTENQLSVLFKELTPALKSRLVLFVHQPPAWFKLHWSDFSIFNEVNSVVCLCQSQADFFKKHTKQAVHIIKHGVDLDFFQPNVDVKKTNRNLLFVGQWMRDFNMLYASFQLITKQLPDIVLHCVLPQKFRHHPSLYTLAQCENVFWYNDISSNELLALYQTSDILFLPLIDSTANNALNEATSCGLPIVTTSIGGASDYVYKNGALLAPAGNDSKHADAVVSMLEKIRVGEINTLEIRNHAEKTLHWKKQAEQLVFNLTSLV